MGESAKLHSDLEALVGATIHDRYEVEALLGSGGMGAVFKAHHTGLKRGVAIKVLHPEIGRDEAVSKRFDREAHSASRLDHPNCVRVTDFGTTDNGTKYLVMELLEGGDLDERLGQPWAPDRAVTTIEQVLHGLDHAHHVGVVHRDLKPENIFVTRDFRGEEVVKIVDFGIAKLIDEQGAEKLTRQGMVFGTPRYMSPEQAAGGKIDERTDLYAVGLILYELLAGRPPFESDDAAALLRLHIMAPPPPLPDSVPPALARIVDKLLEKSKGDRYASAREVLDALAQVETAGAGAALAAPAVPAPSLGAGADPEQPTTELPTTSNSAWQPGPVHAANTKTGSHAGVGQPPTGPFPSVAAGSQGAYSHPSMVAANVGAAPRGHDRRWLPLVLAGVTLLFVLAGVGALMSSLTDEQPEAANEEAAAVGAPGDDAPADPIPSTTDDPPFEVEPSEQPAPGPVRPGPRPVRPDTDDSRPKGKSKPSGKPSGKGEDHSGKPKDKTTDDPTGGGGVDPKQAEREREAAAEQARKEAERKAKEAEREAEEKKREAEREKEDDDDDEKGGKGKGKGKGKGRDR